MKIILPFVFFGLLLSSCGQNQSETLNLAQRQAGADKAQISKSENIKKTMEKRSLYDFTVETLGGEKFDFSELKGKRVLIVNTASECGYTPQYEQLQELYEEFGGDGFTIIGFPSNDFGGQEPGSNAEIKSFCQKNYGVTFPMMTKIPVTGKGKHPVYQWLTSEDMNGVESAEVSWNFNKFLIDENGNWVAHYKSSVGPLDERIVAFAEGE